MLVFSDLDGTLLTTNKHLRPRTLAALDALAISDIEFIPSTGRSAGEIPYELKIHPAVHYVIAANGASVLALDEHDKADFDRATTLQHWPLSREHAHAVLAIARKYDVTFDVFGDGHCYLKRAWYERLHEFVSHKAILKSMLGTRRPLDEEPEVTIERVHTLERVAMYWKDSRERDAILDELSCIEGIEVTRSYPMNIEIMEAGTSKGTAATWLCEHLGQAAADAFAFGDNLNDIEMLTAVGHGYAVANAEAEVLAHAPLCCPANDDDGVAQVLEQLV
ncbi:Cof-type HAD-IIB family hydrolase [Collinsella sp. zg1085]|uniref:Cof-type HAD-IIB family hydrolase n=1 Tax=Collinsella sp. zg1085 TaxID=2844380 RepID=UPI001C0BA5EB|nr:Cof-type HAD-IIB family hydrolase [Collinsella sp. zg1085]QWT17955.1 Cof-type HAD-IIB family hydrolase [Collinsella sp. zg1085]